MSATPHGPAPQQPTPYGPTPPGGAAAYPEPPAATAWQASPAVGATPGRPWDAEAPYRPLLGWVLLVPAVVLLVWQLAIPTLRTQALATQDVQMVPLGGSQGEFVGLDNYVEVLALTGLGPWFGAVVMGVLPTLVGLGIGVVVGLAQARTGASAGRLAYVLLGVSLAFVAPLSAALAYLGPAGLIGRVGGGSSLGLGPAIVVALLVWFVLPAVLAAVVTSASLRGDGVGGTQLVVLGIVTLLGGVAWGAQSFVVPFLANAETPAFVAYRTGFIMADLGLGAAASAMIGAIATVCGVVAMIVLVASRLRLEIAPEVAGADGAAGYDGVTAGAAPTPQRSGVAGAVAAGALLLVAVVVALPWLTQLGNTAGGQPASAVTTWLPSALGGVLALGVAGLAGAGIGYLRPLGRGSEWLLLVFSPGLFFGFAPVMTVAFLDARDLEMLGTFWSLVPTILVVPFVVLATYVGAAVRRAGSGAARALVRPVGAVALAALTTFVWLSVQSLLRDLIMTVPPNLPPASVVVLQGMFEARGSLPLGLLTPLPVLVVVAGLLGVAFAGLTRWRVVRAR
ncbi:hypothetical protein Bcav_0991 [Beutenbergia cavernae DSM 12333]|uniref:Uncharacterized protein n=1 Tax=Beutenbergia cavernae (strain ATCC BAA-8 / DSM 12333 / CCUG 43141 / JCM 11478 / NBRC 16432 / NCIMB 13614 / HKI 0122) TaxID=471853 RepID=C5C066_BEUC1|nr:hypothetical protein [Beutenbergia cavernae]ACQ79252.1 hypothetical protein Bcav_0991 [Beutenbergia cavernae DSM 12333]